MTHKKMDYRHSALYVALHGDLVYKPNVADSYSEAANERFRKFGDTIAAMIAANKEAEEKGSTSS